MPATKTLARFTVNPGKGGYQMHIEDDDGETIEFTATRDKLDVIADALDDLLAEDEDDDTTAEELDSETESDGEER
jgi:hypothetical protein